MRFAQSYFAGLIVVLVVGAGFVRIAVLPE
jgi:hypothetical protein